MRQSVRSGTIGIAIAAWSVAVFAAPRPAKLPGAALHSEFLWRTEIAAGILLGLLLVFVTVMRGWRGELPHTFSDKGASWSEVAEVAEDGLAATRSRMDQLQTQIDSLAEELATLRGQGW
jgi:hypothetical protein